ncbi:MAG: hypothetical protein KGK14_06545 [Bacteroidota bacterium]|nr:hypothetical protein [Bacteroidota bacterium]
MASIFFSKKGLIALLSFTLVITFTFYYFFAIKIDKEYSKLISGEARFNDISQNILQSSYANWSLFLQTAYNNKEKHSNESWQKMIAQNNFRFDSISNKNLLHTADGLILDSLKIARKKYNTLIIYYYQHMPQNKDSLQLIIEQVLQPAFNQYQFYLIKFLKAHNNGMIEQSNTFTFSNLFKSKLYLLVGLIPVFVLIFIGMIIFVYVLIIGYEIIKI